MKEQNQAERRNIFIKFLALFIVGILLVTIPIYLTMSLPQKELKTLQQQEKLQQEIFSTKIDSLNMLIQQYETEDIHILNPKIGNLIGKLEHSIPADSSWRNDMYRNISQAYRDILSTRSALDELNKELSDCQRAKRAAQSQAAKPKESNTSLVD